MILARVLADTISRWGLVEDGFIRLLESPPYESIQASEARLPFDEAVLLPPAEPSVILGLGRNYASHNAEVGVEAPETPAVFFKPPSCLAGHGSPIVIPGWATRVDYEGELGVVIGRELRNVEPEHVLDHVLGYTCFNDVTERHMGGKGLLNQDISKCCDTFGPCGPYLVTGLEPDDLEIVTRVNGVVRQRARTSECVFPLRQVLSFVSRFMTLRPGDLVITGTPGGLGSIAPGDVVEVSIEGIGTLSNPVRLEPSSGPDGLVK